jgi:hypothetical protein
VAFKYFNVKNGLVTGNILLHAGNGVIAANTFNGSLDVTDSANLGNVRNIKITGGQANYVLQTDGTGNLSWVEQSGGGSQVAGSNTQVQFNNNGNFSGSNTFTFDSSNTLLTVNNFVATSSANLGDVANVTLGGGTNGYYLQTDGSGNISWSSVSTGINVTVNDYVGDGANTEFSLTKTPENANYTLVSVGGVMQPRTTYTVVNNTLTFSSAPPDTAPIEVTIFEAGGSGYQSEFTGNVTGNLSVAGTTFVTGDIIPTSNNTVNLGSPTNRFGTLYLAANTIDLGGTILSTTQTGDLKFTTGRGNFDITANTVNFLNSVATTAISQGAPVRVDVAAGGSNTQVQFNDGGDFSGNAGLTFNKTTQTLTANFVSGNGSKLSNITGANISGNVANATFATTAGTVTTAAQPNITSVGTLTSLTVTSNVTGANFIGNGSRLTSITGANVTGTVANATYAISAGSATVATSANAVAVANVTGIGNIATVNLNGNSSQILAGNGIWIGLPSNAPSNIPPNNQTAAYVLVASDVGKYINITTGGVTVPSGVFSSGDTLSIYNNSASNQTITQSAGVTIYQVGTATTGNRTLAQRGLATLLCVGSNEFVITGGGLT